MTTQARREALAEALREHRAIVSGDTDGWHVVCSCGHNERGSDTEPHEADALLLLVSKWIAESAALAAYLASGKPPICPRCGGWDGPRLPMCTDPGWEHHESCTRTRYSEDICGQCATQLETEGGR